MVCMLFIFRKVIWSSMIIQYDHLACHSILNGTKLGMAKVEPVLFFSPKQCHTDFKGSLIENDFLKKHDCATNFFVCGLISYIKFK